MGKCAIRKNSVRCSGLLKQPFAGTAQQLAIKPKRRIGGFIFITWLSELIGAWEMIRKGEKVEIKPEWQDKGDDLFTWMALEDEDGGRVRISPVDIGYRILPYQVVDTSMLVTE